MIRTPKGCRPIGRGAFTRAFVDQDGDVILFSSCNAKEVMALGWFPEHRLIPPIRRVGLQTYVMPLYQTPTYAKALNFRGRDDLAVLRRVMRAWLQNPKRITDSTVALRKAMYREGAHLAPMLLDCVGAMMNYTECVGFEPTPRNLGHDAEGNLFLLDAFFDVEQARRRPQLDPDWDGRK